MRPSRSVVAPVGDFPGEFPVLDRSGAEVRERDLHVLLLTDSKHALVRVGIDQQHRFTIELPEPRRVRKLLRLVEHVKDAIVGDIRLDSAGNVADDPPA